MNLLKGTFLRHKLFSTKSTIPQCEYWNHHLFLPEAWISQREKCPNTEFFLVRIFLHSDWIRRNTSMRIVYFCSSIVTLELSAKHVEGRYFRIRHGINSQSFQKRNSIINHNDRSQNLPIEMSCFVCFTNQNSFFVDRIEYEKLRYQSTFLMMQDFQFQMGHNIQEWTK